mmetsp:Transcript_11293/g.25432  ORF Transcript_11293/g.25432 Transcript_11293/m.25432 type:complete len:217 (-) Transcript_11293:292-942(-)
MDNRWIPHAWILHVAKSHCWRRMSTLGAGGPASGLRNGTWYSSSPGPSATNSSTCETTRPSAGLVFSVVVTTYGLSSMPSGPILTLPEFLHTTLIVFGAVTEQHTSSHRDVSWSKSRRTCRQYGSKPSRDTSGSENLKSSEKSSGSPRPVTNHSRSRSPSLMASRMRSVFSPVLLGAFHAIASRGPPLISTVSLGRKDLLNSMSGDLASTSTAPAR